MTIKELQANINSRTGNVLRVDGDFGPASQAAFLAMLRLAGNKRALVEEDYVKAAKKLGAAVPAVKAVKKVESGKAAFQNGLPVILYEPHIFSRLTNRRYDISHPTLSSRSWNRRLYPAIQEGRWKQIMQAMQLNPGAALQAASYGAFQILGSNYKVCGFSSVLDFVISQSINEATQLDAFCNFVIGNNLHIPLQRLDWAKFARGYNGPAYAENKYDVLMAKAYKEFL